MRAARDRRGTRRLVAQDERGRRPAASGLPAPLDRGRPRRVPRAGRGRAGGSTDPGVSPPATADAVRGLPRRSQAPDRASCSSAAPTTTRSAALLELARSSTGRSAARTSATTRSSRSRARATCARGSSSCCATRSTSSGSPAPGEHPAGERALDRAGARARASAAKGSRRRYLKIGGRWRDHEHWAILAEDSTAGRVAQALGPRTCRESPSDPRAGRAGWTSVPQREGMSARWSGDADDARHQSGPWTSRRSARSANASRRDSLSEGPVRFLLVSGEQDDCDVGTGRRVLALDRRERGGFLVSPRGDLARHRDGPELQERPVARLDRRASTATGRDRSAWRARS